MSDKEMQNNNWFVDLAPVSRSEKGSIYQNALDFCVLKDDIFNIALTGPYGSGKSSIIKGYKSNLKDDVKLLEISLASFEDNETPTDAEIELSILQQMIYSAPSTALPFSRFKRIKTPKYPGWSALIITLWLISTLILIKFHKELFSIPIWGAEFFIFIPLLTCFLVGTWFLVKQVFVSLFGSSLRKVSLKNFEIEKEVNQASILNKHVDEVLYFFEQTDYNLVVFEDLDRFNLPKIFIKLRELNTLINKSDSVGSKRHVQFLYALKDSTFTDKDRTKFFEFIIPVVPVVGSSNSLDIILERSNSLPVLKKEIDKDFLRDVSDFLNDARLIHNAFNEFVVYVQEINDSEIDPTSLFAVILYKVVFGEDFELLHNSEGALYNIVEKKYEMLDKHKSKLEELIDSNSEEIKVLQKEIFNREAEIVSAFVGELARSDSNTPSVGIFHGGFHLPYSDLKRFEDIEKLISSKEYVYLSNGGRHTRTGRRYSEVENTISPDISIKERLNLINRKSNSEIKELQKEINKAADEVRDLEKQRLAYFLKSNPDVIDSFIKSNEQILVEKFNGPLVASPNSVRLFRYLLLSGYLNEDYYLYTAIFREREGWGPNDRLFNMIMKSRDTPTPELVVDNPSEVCKKLKDSDFCDIYILNVSIFDYLLEPSNNEFGKSRLALTNLIESFDEDACQEFLRAYFLNGRKITELINYLLKNHEQFLYQVIESTDTALYVSKILSYAHTDCVLRCYDLNMLRSYLDSNCAFVFSLVKDESLNKKIFEMFKALDVKVFDLNSLSDIDSLVEFIVSNYLFRVSVGNVGFVLRQQSFLDSDIESKPLSLLSKADPTVYDYVGRNLGEYVQSLVSQGDKPINEPLEIIKLILNVDDVSQDNATTIIKRQSEIYPDFDNVKEVYWQTILQEFKVSPSWSNLFVCYNSTKVSDDAINAYVENTDVNSQLKLEGFDLGGDAEEIEGFKSFILSLNDLEDTSYINLCAGLQSRLSEFPNVSKEKMLLLIQQEIVSLNEETLDYLSEDTGLLFSLIKNNLEAFFENIEIYTDVISYDLAVKFFKDNAIPNSFKSELSAALQADVLGKGDELSRLVAPYYVEIDSSKMNKSILEQLIVSTHDESVGLVLLKRLLEYSKPQELLPIINELVDSWSESSIMSALKLLDIEISNIANYGKQTVLPKTEIHLELTDKLVRRSYVSNVKDQGDTIRVYTKMRPKTK